jgi:hypothetical protein
MEELDLQIEHSKEKLNLYKLLLQKVKLKRKQEQGKQEPTPKKSKIDHFEKETFKIQTRSSSKSSSSEPGFMLGESEEETNSSQEESEEESEEEEEEFVITPKKNSQQKSPSRKVAFTPVTKKKTNDDSEEDEEDISVKATDLLKKLENGIILNWDQRGDWFNKMENVKCISQFVDCLLTFLENMKKIFVQGFNVEQLKKKIEKSTVDFRNIWEILYEIGTKIDAKSLKPNFKRDVWLKKLK